MKSQLLYNVSASLVCLMLGALPASAQQIAKTDPTTRPQVMESYGKLPLSFEANKGQTDPRIKFLSRGSGYTLFLTEDSAVLSLHGKKANAALRMKLLGANAHAAISGADSLPGKSNYFNGNDPKQWRTNVATYASVKYAGVYAGIDLVYHGNRRLLEYDFVVAPGADPRVIDLSFQGAKRVSVNRDGDLVLRIGDSEVIEQAPVIYQEIGGQRKTVAGKYVSRRKNRVGFIVAAYDENRPLVIDPTLVYSTYLGGSGDDSGLGIAVDASGEAFVTGITGSGNFPDTLGAVRTGAEDVFVIKLNAAGSALIYSTFLGGSEMDGGNAIAVDTSGSAYVTGVSYSADFPTTSGAVQKTFGGRDLQCAFVSKLNASGSGLVYSTYLGYGSGGYGIAVDPSGNAYITGYTFGDFPITPGAVQSAYAGNDTDAFVSKLNAAGSALVYSTYLGVNATGHSIAVDSTGSAYVTGWTGPGFPTTPGAFQTTYKGYLDAFVTKLDATGSALVYSTYLGGSTEAWGYAIAVDGLGSAYVTGETDGDFPITVGAFQKTFQSASGGGGDAFVTKLNAAGSGLIYSTYLGGGLSDSGFAIAVDASGSAYVTGDTYSSNFPITARGSQTTFSGRSDAFVTKLNPAGSVLVFSTCLGGSLSQSDILPYDHGIGIAVDNSGNAYVTGATASADFPTTTGAFQATHGGGRWDAFVSKLAIGSGTLPAPVTAASLNGPLGSNGWYLGTVTVSLVVAGGNPVSATYYSIDGSSYIAYGAPFSIAGDGTHQVFFYSVDTSGNQETPHGQTINIDSTRPASHVAALTASAASPNFKVQWAGTDATSGLHDCTIFVSDNGGQFIPWQSHVATTQAYYSGYLGHTYSFYSIAVDNAGNQENLKSSAEATTQTPAQLAGDLNSDGKIDCSDLAIVKTSMGKSTGQTGFDPRADVNHDGVVNVFDLAFVSQKLAVGTKCP